MGYGMEHGHCCGGHHPGGYGGHHQGFGGMKSHHACPFCGMMHRAEAGFGAMEAGMGSHKVVNKAVKKLLIEKTKAKIDARWGDKLDAIAQELVDMAEEKMKMKKDMWKRKQEMRERLHEILAEEAEEG